jgi:hypothetical protein
MIDCAAEGAESQVLFSNITATGGRDVDGLRWTRGCGSIMDRFGVAQTEGAKALGLLVERFFRLPPSFARSAT